MTWQVPSQVGKTFVVTGGNAGIGYFIAEQLARVGAHVVIAARNPDKIAAAIASIEREVAGASVSSVILDLSSFASVRNAAKELAELPRIDALIENAGSIMPPGGRQETVDGNELMFGTNHLGHFLLTALLYPALKRTPGSRVITMGSGATKLRPLAADDLQATSGRYSAFTAYAQSKHATQGFGFELDRRLRAAGSPVTSIVVHPGGGTDGNSPFRSGINEPTPGGRTLAKLMFVVGGSKEVGARATVRAATDPDAQGGQYWGPRFQVVGEPALSKPAASSASPEFGAKLWAMSEELTGQPFIL
jgi:NAD(P)-dependent dehydrogenase (short-subunit alcohol dehydrogenase family)